MKHNHDHRQREQRKAAAFWKELSNHDRWEIGDALVLGDFDWRDWLPTKPTSAFLHALDRERILWECA